MKVFLAVLLCAAFAVAAETKIEKKDLPAAVQKAADEQTKGAQIKGYSKEIEKGKTLYEVETSVNGHGRDLTFDATGKLVETEEEIAIDRVPAAAKAAIEKASTGGKLNKVEAVTHDNKTVYEASITKGGKKSEVLFNGDGTKGKE